ncbi:MAG: ATP-binding protein [Peptoniphilus sp.]|nr:ATP-binding protein [Peptoniphilus sp.]MDD7363629.1 ATP-binding protein [Bacillota bacterium]MDY6044726.1 ATP-binding protein [Peptoniphilus sp.]
MKRISSIMGSVQSDMRSLHAFIADAMRQVAYYVKDNDLQYNIRLVIDELLLNGADHGNAWDSQKKVHLRIDFKPEELCITVRDEGAGIKHRLEDVDCTNDSCSGRGLFIVNAICDSVHYDGNTVRCYLDI